MVLGQAVKIKQAKGFTLTEMVMVIAIFAIVSAIAFPQYTVWRDNQNLKEAARDLSSDIALWRQRAVAENIGYRIVLDQGAGSYIIQRATTTIPGPEDYADLAPSVTKSFSLISSQLNISNITFSGTPPRIYIQARGTINPPGMITLQHDNLAGRKADIIANTMGRVRVEYGSI